MHPFPPAPRRSSRAPARARARSSSTTALFPAALFAALFFLAPPAQAQIQTQDPWTGVVGQPIPPDSPRPAAMPGALRSFRAPIAIHGPPGTTAETLHDDLAIAERAFDALTSRFALPEPAPDGDRGGGPELDLYLVADGPPSEAVPDALEYGALWDRASAFVRVRSDLTGDDRERAIAEGIAQATLWGIDARAVRPWRIALASFYAARATGLGLDLADVARFQRDPGAPLFNDRDDDSARGAALFVEFIAARYDTPDLRLLRGLAWMPVAHTPGEAPHFADEPDVFDVMQRLFRDERGGLEGVITEFSIARMMTGTHGDEMNFAAGADDPALLPDAQRTVTYESLPAFVTSRPLTAETGVAYVWIDTHHAGNGTLNVWFHGLPWRRWGVTLVRMDSNGRMTGRAASPPAERGEWSTTLQDLTNVDRVLLVINDFGNGDYDPDERPDRGGWFSITISR